MKPNGPAMFFALIALIELGLLIVVMWSRVPPKIEGVVQAHESAPDRSQIVDVAIVTNAYPPGRPWEAVVSPADESRLVYVEAGNRSDSAIAVQLGIGRTCLLGKVSPLTGLIVLNGWSDLLFDDTPFVVPPHDKMCVRTTGMTWHG